jgi:16S rRNA (guanine966-N2)-methyltransferase
MGALEGASVLDAFAGSGALGIEALSRGAGAATFVDSDPRAIAAVRANLGVLGALAARATVVRSDTLRYLDGAPPFDVVLADPPYAYRDWEPFLRDIAPRCATLVAETARAWEPDGAWETVKVKRYGDTVVAVARPAHEREPRVRPEGEI